MKQQINLYQPMFRRQEKVFSALTMLQIVAFFIVVYGVLYGYTMLKLQPFQQELDKTNTQLERMTLQLDEQQKRISSRGKSTMIESEIARLSRELEQGERLREVLTKRSFGNVDGFSSYFAALANGHVDGTWLTTIRIESGGEQLSLNGKSIKAELVPTYIKKLALESIFDNRKFNILELQREEEGYGRISFNIATGG